MRQWALEPALECGSTLQPVREECHDNPLPWAVMSESGYGGDDQPRICLTRGCFMNDVSSLWGV